MPINFADTASDQLEFPSYYYYHLSSSNGMDLYVLRDESPPRITGGTGGWEIVNRRRRKGLTNWTGREPWQMVLPVLFNGWFDPPYSVDADVAVLNRMAFGDNFVIPPTVLVDGFVPITGLKWVIQSIEYGTNVHYLRSDSGNPIRVRQDAVINLLQYVEEDVVKVNPGTVPGAPKPYVTKKGDTAKSIAKARYGDANMWKAIRNLNPSVIRDPNQVLKAGITLQMPPTPKS